MILRCVLLIKSYLFKVSNNSREAQGLPGFMAIALACLMWGRVKANNPTLISFEYSVGFGYLVLNFDRDVLADSLDPRGLELLRQRGRKR